VGEAFFWGAVGASSLVVGAVVALLVPIPRRVLGWIMAFGSGVLVSAVAFDLVEEAVERADGAGTVALGLAAGALTFYAGDAVIDRMGGDKRKSSGGEQAAGTGLAIVLGAVLDGIPESLVLGVGLLGGAGVSVAFLAAVFISNWPTRWCRRRSTTAASRSGCSPPRGSRWPSPSTWSSSRAGQGTSRIGGRANAGNRAGPNVVTSAIRPSSIRSTSNLNARNSVSPGRRR
jgi:hypothetical protein